MKKVLLMLGACALIAFATSASGYDGDFYSIKILDVSEGLPVVTVGGYFTNVTITLEKESAIINGTAANILSDHVNLESLMLNLNEAPPFISWNGYPVSDFILFQSVGDNFTITFKSDGASGFDTAFYTGIDGATGNPKPDWAFGGVWEDGSMQWLGSVGIDAPEWIQLYGQSDVAPLPGTVLLLGAGLLGMIGICSRRKSS